jgi:ribosome-associated heat shock protein Hsp15
MYKSRSIAADAIKGGKVKMNGSPIKPSHHVKPGEQYVLSIGQHQKIIEVKSLIEKRGSFDVAKQHYIDLSPPAEKEDKLKSVFYSVNIKREKGSGRPTKKERRDLDDFGW